MAAFSPFKQKQQWDATECPRRLSWHRYYTGRQFWTATFELATPMTGILKRVFRVRKLTCPMRAFLKLMVLCPPLRM